MDILRGIGAATIAALLMVPATAGADGVVNRLRIDPHGRVAGVFLRDGTEIDAAPSSAGLGQAVRPGDAVRLTFDRGGQAMLFDQRTRQSLNLGPSGPQARGGGPRASGPVTEYAQVDNATNLPSLSVDGRVAQVTHSARGVPTGLLMDNGTQVDIAPGVEGALNSVHPGDVLHVDGRGTRTPQGTSLWALVITTPDRGVILDMNRGPGAPELGFRR